MLIKYIVKYNIYIVGNSFMKINAGIIFLTFTLFFGLVAPLCAMQTQENQIQELPGFTMKGIKPYRNNKAIGYGFFNENGKKVAAVVRFNENGTLDKSFGFEGLVILRNGHNQAVTGLDIASDGGMFIYLNGSKQVSTMINAKGVAK
jgi:hypothetical protein